MAVDARPLEGGPAAGPSLKILLVRFSAIGDCVMTAWAATSIRQRFPDAEIAWVIEPRCRAVLAPSLAEVVEYPRDRWKRMGNKLARFREEWALYAGLRRRRFDWGLDFQGHSKTALLLRLAMPKKRLMARATDKFAACLNPLMPGNPREHHVVDWNYQTLARFGDFERVERPRMPEPLAKDSRLATICVGAGAPDKMWPIERWSQVGSWLATKGWRVKFVGGPGDPDPGSLEGCENLVGKLELAETVRLVGGSGLHLAADTGTGHMAAAYGVPAVSIFGPSPAEVFRPYSALSKVLRRGTSTLEVTVEDVMEAVCAF